MRTWQAQDNDALTVHSTQLPLWQQRLLSNSGRWTTALSLALALQLLLLAMLSYRGVFVAPITVAAEAAGSGGRIVWQGMDSLPPRTARLASAPSAAPALAVPSHPQPAVVPPQSQAVPVNAVVPVTSTALPSEAVPVPVAVHAPITSPATTTTATTTSEAVSAASAVSATATAGASSASVQGGVNEDSGGSGYSTGAGSGSAQAGEGSAGTVSAQMLRHPYFGRLQAWLQRYKTYPAELKKAKRQGTVVLAFSIDRQGNLLSARIITSSGEAALDAASLDMLRRASPMPALPAELGLERLSLTIPVNYALITR